MASVLSVGMRRQERRKRFVLIMIIAAALAEYRVEIASVVFYAGTVIVALGS